jgi:hypothetical protein
MCLWHLWSSSSLCQHFVQTKKNNKENGPSLLLLPHPISRKSGEKKKKKKTNSHFEVEQFLIKCQSRVNFMKMQLTLIFIYLIN